MSTQENLHSMVHSTETSSDKQSMTGTIPSTYPDGRLRPELGLVTLFPMDSHYAWFQSFADNLSSTDVAIVTDHEDDKPPQYSFSSRHLRGLSPQDTLCRAKKLLALLSGALMVLGYEWMDRPLKLAEGWYWDETKRQRVYTGSEPGFALEFPPEINQFSYRAWSPNSPLSIEGKLLFLCHSDAATLSILKILGTLGVTYSSLYSVLDCLLGVGGMTKADVAARAGSSQAELKRFTGTANHFGVLGVEARHGNMNWDLPKDPPLPLNDSKRLILKATQSFLLDRVRTLFPPAWAAADGPAQTT